MATTGERNKVMGLLDVKGYNPALLEDPVHSGDSYITSKIFNSGADMPPGNHPTLKLKNHRDHRGTQR